MLDDDDRLRALADSELMDSEPEAAFDRLTQVAARLLEVPVSLITVLDGNRQFFKSAAGISVRETPLSHSFCRHVVIGRRPLIVTDARTDPRVSENRAIEELGVIAYCGVPLTTAAGHTLGSFCAIDSAPRNWNEEDVRLLEDLARGIITELELRAANRKLAAREIALSLSVDRLNRTLEHAPIGMALTAPDGRWLQVNRAMCEILGYPESDLLGLTFQALSHPDDLRADLAQVQRLLTAEIDAYRTEKRYVGRDGEHIWVEESVTLMRDRLGAPLYFITQLKDVSERKADERALRGERAALDDAERIARVGSWSWDAAAATAQWSAGVYRIFGRHPELGPASGQELLSCVHPDDRERVAAQARASIARAGELELEAGIVREGHRGARRIRVGGRPDPERPGAYIGTAHDVTELREAERAATRRSGQLAAVMAALGDGCAVSLDGAIVEVNDALCELTGFHRDELLGRRPPLGLLVGDEQSRAALAGLETADGGAELTLRDRRGERFRARVATRSAELPGDPAPQRVYTVRALKSGALSSPAGA